jgi:hypothetical protein
MWIMTCSYGINCQLLDTVSLLVSSTSL